MAFFSGDRRRRVLTEQMIAPAAEPTATQKPSSRVAATPSYASGALKNQPTVADLLPRRYSTLAIWFLLLALLVAGLETLFVYRTNWSAVLSPERAAALNVTLRGSLASWFSSMLLAASAAVSLILFSLRRHRMDDHRGRYRVWILAALCWLGFSAGIASGLHLVVMDVGASLSGWKGWLNGDVWWLMPAAIVVGGVGIRLAVEMRRCRLATLTMLLALACWSTATAVHFEWLTLPVGPHAPLAITSAMMAGHALLLMSLLVYARHVVLDAGGKIPSRPRKAKADKKVKAKKQSSDAKKNGADDADAKKSRTLRVDEPHGSKTGSSYGDSSGTGGQRAKSTTQWTNGSDSGGDDYDDDDDSFGARKLSKAERKRLRRERAREERTGS